MPSPSADHRQFVTLLFTDIVGSTQLKQDLGDRAALALLQRHHALVREILGQFRGGQEISTAGDSFFLSFGNPSDAVRFALLLHAGLRALTQTTGRPLFDRIGIHVGEVFVESGEGSSQPMDLHGIQVDTCSRLMSLAKANQILMTRSVFDNARQFLRGQDLAGVGALAWMNHGPYVLKGVEEPLEVCEVSEASAGPLTPPTNSDKAQRHASADEEPVLGWRPALEQLVPNTQWVLERKLGEGGFGEVWLGRHDKLQERRVFKFCFRADRVRALKREVTLFRLMKEKVGQHPNIVGIQEVFFDAPPFYIVMDYAEGRDLRAWSEERGGVERIPLAARLEIVAQVADALQAAHAAGVIHRDVKPSNILVSGRDGVFAVPNVGDTEDSIPPSKKGLQVKLTDFGIGQVVTQEALAGLTKLGFTQTMMSPGSTQTGTHLYMAPELLAGQPASTRSDLYSLGVVLYQLLIGDFGRPVTIDWARAIQEPLLREDLQKCLAGTPEERFDSASELAKKLRDFERRQDRLAAGLRASKRRELMQRVAVAVSSLVVLGFMFVVARQFMGQQKRAVSPPLKTIAVFPFRNDSPDPADEYLSDALTTEIISGLQKVPGLNAVRPATLSPEQMRTFFAQAHWPFFEGTIKKNAGKTIISGRLVDSEVNRELWATNYDRAAGHYLGIPNDLVLHVAEHSGVPISGETRKRIQKPPTKNEAAYDDYLRGRFYVLKASNRAQFEAHKPIESLERAVQQDPNFAGAYADLARGYVRRYFYFEPEAVGVLEPKAFAAIQRALKLDPELPEGNFALGFYYWTPSQQWQHGKAIHAFRLAVEKNPHWEEAMEYLTLIYIHVGLFEQGHELVNKLILNNPLKQGNQAYLANALIWEGKNEEAVEIWRRILNGPSVSFIQKSYFAVALSNLGKTNEAVEVIQAALKIDPQDTGGLYASVQAILLAKAGDVSAALKEIKKALDLAKGFGHSHHAVYNIAAAYALLNMPVDAVKYLRAAAGDGFPCYRFFKADPNLRQIRQHPDYLGFMKEQAALHEQFKKEFGKE